MFKDLLRIKQRLSIAQYCLISGGIIAFLGLYSSINAVTILDKYIEHITSHEPHAYRPDFARYSNDGYIASLGQLLRSNDAPFTKINSDSKHIENELIETLHNVRAGLTYIWIWILFSIIFCVLWMTKNVHQPFNVIALAVKRLSNNQLSTPIELVGPKNVTEVSIELEQLRRRLRRNERQQMLFLRHVSHEINTPLASIKEGANLLRDQSLGALNSEQNEVTNILLRAGNDLHRSIENLLSYNSVISIRNQQNMQLTDIVRLLDRVLEKHQLSLQRNNVRIRKILSPVAIWVDADQMSTVFDNLLSNAIKYAPEESEIRIWLKRNRNGVVEFTIRDQGPGVSKEHRNAIFEPFYMGDESVNATIKGTGIGLSLARQYVEAHNGSIRLLESRTGATFKISIEPN